MKKIITLLLVLMCLCGCGKIDGGNLDDIKKRGYVLVALEGTWSPWCYHNENDELVGFDVDVAKYIADYLGVDIKFSEGDFDGILAGIEAKRSDMVLNGVDVTEERKKAIDFSNAYAYDRIVVIVNSDNDSIKSLEDLKGKTTANTSLSTYADIGREYGANVQPVDDLNETFLLLKDNRIDATINAEMTFLDYMGENPDAKFKVACTYGQSPEIAAAIPKGSTALVEEVNKAIAAAYEDGTLEKLSMKYFNTNITVK